MTDGAGGGVAVARWIGGIFLSGVTSDTKSRVYEWVVIG